MRYLLSALLFLLSSFTVNAQNVLKIMMDDQSEITVSIDGRDYKKVGRVLTFVDIPAGWHDLRVYRFIPYRDGGGRAKLVYSSRIRLKKGNVTTCVVDGSRGRMSVDNRDLYDEANRAVPIDEPTQNHVVVKEVLTEEELDSWQKKVETIPTDIEKKKAVQDALKGMEFNVTQLKQMLGWFAFESTKMEVAKWCYDKVSDPQNYKQLMEVFSLESSKNELNKFIDTK